MRRCYSLFLVLCIVGAVITQVRSQYITKYDNVDVDRILSNQRILTNYLKCLMDEGPCTNEGKELKKTLPDALAGECSKCTDKQRASAEKVIRFLIKNRTNDWKRLTTKYDPTGQYRKRYEARYNTKT
ncbi:putative chemosensory protein [Trypoxylus dichotomus]